MTNKPRATSKAVYLQPLKERDRVVKDRDPLDAKEVITINNTAAKAIVAKAVTRTGSNNLKIHVVEGAKESDLEKGLEACKNRFKQLDISPWFPAVIPRVPTRLTMQQLREEIEVYNRVKLASDPVNMTFNGDPNAVQRTVKVFFKTAEDYAYFKRHHICVNGRIHKVFKYAPRERPAPSQEDATTNGPTEQQGVQEPEAQGEAQGADDGQSPVESETETEESHQ